MTSHMAEYSESRSSPFALTTLIPCPSRVCATLYFFKYSDGWPLHHHQKISTDLSQVDKNARNGYVVVIHKDLHVEILRSR